MNPAEAAPWHDCRSPRVEEMGEAVPRRMRARRPRSRVGIPLGSLRSLRGRGSARPLEEQEQREEAPHPGRPRSRVAFIP